MRTPWTRITFGAALGVAVLITGCSKKTSSSTAVSGKEEEFNPAGHVQRGRERLVHQNYLEQIASFYNQYYTQFGRPPADLMEFKDFMHKDAPMIYQAIDQGRIIVKFKVTPSTNTVIAYERDVDLNGNHLVTMGDGSTSLVKHEKLQELLRKEE